MRDLSTARLRVYEGCGFRDEREQDEADGGVEERMQDEDDQRRIYQPTSPRIGAVRLQPCVHRVAMAWTEDDLGDQGGDDG